MEEIVNRLLDLIEKKDQQIERLTNRLVELTMPYSAHIRSTLPSMEAVTPVYMSEDEQDLQAAYEARLITKSELEDKLQELQFMNTEIVFHE